MYDFAYTNVLQNETEKYLVLTRQRKISFIQAFLLKILLVSHYRWHVKTYHLNNKMVENTIQSFFIRPKSSFV